MILNKPQVESEWSGLGPPMIFWWLVIWLFDSSLFVFRLVMVVWCTIKIGDQPILKPTHLKFKCCLMFFFLTSLRFLQSLCNHRLGYQQEIRRLHPRNETKNQWDFQGTPRTWDPPYGKAGPILFPYLYMDVSENSGTPKSSHFNWVFHCKPPSWGSPNFGNTHIALESPLKKR